MPNYAKQSQFAGGANWRNMRNNNSLWIFKQAGATKKQSQFTRSVFGVQSSASRSGNAI